MSHQWLYKDSIENGVMVLLEDVEQYKKDGWVDPADLGKEVIKVVINDDLSQLTDIKVEGTDDLDAMSKKDLELYAKEMFGVDIDRRKNNKTLVTEIRALEAN